MELSKQEMELIFLLPDLKSKNTFYKMFLTFTNESKTGFEIGNGIIDIETGNGNISLTSQAPIKNFF